MDEGMLFWVRRAVGWATFYAWIGQLGIYLDRNETTPCVATRSLWYGWAGRWQDTLYVSVILWRAGSWSEKHHRIHR